MGVKLFKNVLNFKLWHINEIFYFDELVKAGKYFPLPPFYTKSTEKQKGCVDTLEEEK